MNHGANWDEVVTLAVVARLLLGRAIAPPWKPAAGGKPRSGRSALNCATFPALQGISTATKWPDLGVENCNNSHEDRGHFWRKKYTLLIRSAIL